jgi:hypothetical protein
MAASAMKVAGDDHDSPGWWWCLEWPAITKKMVVLVVADVTEEKLVAADGSHGGVGAGRRNGFRRWVADARKPG